jgi:hypothetical protein
MNKKHIRIAATRDPYCLPGTDTNDPNLKAVLAGEFGQEVVKQAGIYR